MRKQYKYLYKKYFKGSNNSITFLIILITISTIIGSLSPYLFGIVIDALVSKNIKLLPLILGLYVLILIISSILVSFQSFLKGKIQLRLSNAIKEHLFSNVTFFRSSTKDKYPTGELINRINGDSGIVVSFYIDMVTSIMTIAVSMSIAVFFLLKISPANAGIALLNFPLVFILNTIHKKPLKQIEKEENILRDNLSSFQYESIHNHQHIKTFRLENVMISKFKKYLNQEYVIYRKDFGIKFRLNTLREICTQIINYAMLYVFAMFIADGSMTIGNMVSFNAYTERLFQGISQIMELHVTSIQVGVSLERLNMIEDEECETIEDNKDVAPAFSSISMKNVSFSYLENEQKVLDGITINIKKPGFYCIVGRNGCGKSTTAKLLMRFYDCKDNSLFINGIDLKKIPIQQVRENIVYVSKDTCIFNDTILNNLLIADPDCDFSQIVQYSKLVGLHDDITKTTEGYNTMLGDNGLRLSSGQMQKLNFIRALMRNGKLYILDEITSDLDGAAEQDFVYYIREIAKKYIVILITHRISSVINSDRTYVLSDGKVESQGTHGDLIRSSALYRELFQLSDDQ